MRTTTVYSFKWPAKFMVTQKALDGAAATWKTTDTTNILPLFMSKMTVDPGNPSVVYMTFSQYDNPWSAPSGHVFNTTDGGLSFTNISGDLPNIPVSDIVLDLDRPNTLYIATDIGVYLTSNGGLNWVPIGVGMPHVVVTWPRTAANRSIATRIDPWPRRMGSATSVFERWLADA